KDGIADNIKFAFYIGAAIFVVAILITIFFSKEYPPEEYERYHGKVEETPAEKGHQGLSEIARAFGRMPKTMRQLGLVQFFSWFAMFSMWVFTTEAVPTHVFVLTGDYVKSKAYNDAGNVVGDAFAA